MAKKNLVRLLFELSQDDALRERYRSDADAVMREYGLSAAGKKLLREGKASKIKAHLGEVSRTGPTIIPIPGPTIIISSTAKSRL